MKTKDIFLLAVLAILAIAFAPILGETSSDLNIYSSDNEADSERVARWILNHLSGNTRSTARDRRTQIDAGFQSRHSALQNYLYSYDAGLEASDPHGPGRRK